MWDMLQLKPKAPLVNRNKLLGIESIYPDEHSCIDALAYNLEKVFLGSDYHLYKELLRGKADPNYPVYVERTQKVIDGHNKSVGKDDLFLFLGDLTEEEFAEDMDPEFMLTVIQELNGIKFMVAGNNDSFDDEYYIRAGFNYVWRKPLWIGTDVFSHEPFETKRIDNKKVTNFHGHLHAKRNYFDIDYCNHIDIFIDDHSFAVRQVRDYRNLFNTDKYKP